MTQLREFEAKRRRHQTTIEASLQFFHEKVDAELRTVKANQEAIMDSMQIHPPEYQLCLDSTEEDDIKPAPGPSSAPSTKVARPSPSSAPSSGGKGSISTIQPLMEQILSEAEVVHRVGL